MLDYIYPGWNINATSSHLECIDKLKLMIKHPFFMDIIILPAWAIWKTKNAFIFKGTTCGLYTAIAFFKEDFKWINSEPTGKLIETLTLKAIFS
jgi:hypothetical protein